MSTKITISTAITLMICTLFFQCGSSPTTKTENNNGPKSMIKEESMKDPLKNKGIGPVNEVILGPIDDKMVAEGKVLFESLCTACHKVEKRFIGPSPKGITKRRSPEWIMNMIMNPEEMLQKDPIAKQLLIEANGAPMANQNVTEENARKILEYFRIL